MEQPRGAVEVHQHPVHDTDVDAPQPYGFIPVPIEVDDHQNNAHGAEKARRKSMIFANALKSSVCCDINLFLF